MPDDRRFEGKVKRWFAEKGLGFIIPDEGGPDLFCHYTVVKVANGSFVRLEEGQEVEYSLDKSDKTGKCERACNVTAPGGGPLKTLGPPPKSDGDRRRSRSRSRRRDRRSRSRSRRDSRSRAPRRDASRSRRASRSRSRDRSRGARRDSPDRRNRRDDRSVSLQRKPPPNRRRDNSVDKRKSPSRRDDRDARREPQRKQDDGLDRDIEWWQEKLKDVQDFDKLASEQAGKTSRSEER
mmetsp:Transcript_3626/g.5881  ORF Transcript_3626/g.5881 Transcript_3626/m.5881 type:complete len:237 (-) Transcript_3626:80-790(-)